MTEEETFEARQGVQGFEDVVRTTAANSVVFEAQRLQKSLVAEHGAKLAHRIVVQVIIVQEDLLEAGVLDKGARDGFETRVTNQV